MQAARSNGCRCRWWSQMLARRDSSTEGASRPALGRWESPACPSSSRRPPVLPGAVAGIRVQVVTKLPRSLVEGAVDAVPRDVTLAQRVAAQQVVHAPGDPTVNSPIFGKGVRGGKYHQVVQDATVGAPVPAVRRGIGLIPRLLLLQVEQTGARRRLRSAGSCRGPVIRRPRQQGPVGLVPQHG